MIRSRTLPFIALSSLALFAPNMARADSCDATRAYQEGMMRMHKNMDIDYSGQVDSDFARGMKPHHEGAIDMANVELRYGKDADIRSMAAWIKTAQEAEIGQMSNWISRVAVEKPYGRAENPKAIQAFKDSMSVMHKQMNIAYSGNPDADFVCGMIPHHQGAIDMAAVEIRSGRDPKMLKLASDIVRSQSGEIAVMKRWLSRNNIRCTLSDMPMSGMHHSM